MAALINVIESLHFVHKNNYQVLTMCKTLSRLHASLKLHMQCNRPGNLLKLRYPGPGLDLLNQRQVTSGFLSF